MSDEMEIINNYMKLQDYMLKHFSIEFFIQQQVEQDYYLIINVDDKQYNLNKKELIVQDFGEDKFEQRVLTIPAIGTVDNVLYSKRTKNILITINPTHKNQMFYYAMLRLSKLNMIILFINFLFKKQSEGVRIDLENFEIEAERIKSLILNYDVKGIDDTIRKLENLENIVYSYLEEFLMPIKRYIDELAPRSQKIEQQTLDEIFNVDVKMGGVVARDKFNPPSWFSVYLFTSEFSKSRELINQSIEDTKLMLRIIRELKEHLLKYQHELKLRKKEQFEATRKIIFGILKDLVDIIKKLLIEFPPNLK